MKDGSESNFGPNIGDFGRCGGQPPARFSFPDSGPAMSSVEETSTVENWGEYSDALVDRGRLTVWVSEEAMKDWKDSRPPQQGAQWIFTDRAIKTCLQLKVVYGLTLRETEGFVESLFGLMGLEDLPVPDYTTLSKRQGDLDIDLPTSSENSHLRRVLRCSGN